jgi:beta-lactamase regulating signal transducer with metallopeptidase domain
MEHFFNAVSLASAAAVGNLIGAIWEGTVLAAAVFLCLRLFPRLSAASRSLVWMNVFLLLVLLHVLPLFGAQRMGTGSARSFQIDLDARWSLGIAGVWALLSLWRAAQLISGAVHLHRLARRATPLALDSSSSSSTPDLSLGALLQAGPRGRAVELCTSAEVARPSVFGFFRPRILLPPALIERLTALELRQVVLHEMEHLRRVDDWTNLLQKIALVLFPLNPVLHWVERRLCAERELACDDRVLLTSGARKAYAVCLTRLAEYSMLRRSFSLVLGAWERRPELVRRVHRVLRRPRRAMSGLQAKLVTACLMLGVLGGALALGRSPQFVGFVATAPLAPTASDDSPLITGGAPDAMRAMKERSAENSARLVQARAVMPEPAVRLATLGAPAVTKMGTHKRPAARDTRRRDIPNDDGWLVLTEWNGTSAPPQAVMAVKFDAKGTYAAVPTKDGWLIVQI